MTQVTINGHPYSDNGEAERDLSNGGHRQWFMPLVHDVVTVAGQAGSSASAANAAAEQAASARDVAVGAVEGIAYPEYLAAIAKNLHAGAVVGVFLYDTSKDSDKGAWRLRCKGTGWENEPLVPGRWLGGPFTMAGAQGAGGVTGDYFQSTDGKYYQFTAPSTLVEVKRGNTREFPALLAIVIEAGRAVAYDATKPELPMWMVFTASPGALLYGPTTLSSVFAINGEFFIGDSGADVGGLYRINFITDEAYRIAGSSFKFRGTIADRNAPKDFALTPGSGIVTPRVNDVAAIVLPDAPISSATGLPVPTVAVATSGGLSILRDNGTVASGTVRNVSWSAKSVSFDDVGRVFGAAADSQYGALQLFSEVPYLSVSTVGQGTSGYPQIGGDTNFGANAFWPYTLGGQNAKTTLIGPAIPSSAGLTLLRENTADRSRSMVAYVTTTYSTGWMVGDIHCAFSSDTAGTVADRSVRARAISGSYSTQPVATGAGLRSFTGATALTATLAANISATGMLDWWEKSSGVWKRHSKNLAGGASYVDGVVGTPSSNVSLSGATLTIQSGVEVANVRASATVATATDIAHAYRTELSLFQPGAQCTIDGSSSAVTALAYDDAAELLHVGTTWGRSTLASLRRVESQATSVGALASLSGSGGAVLQGGTTAARLDQPRINLRDVLLRTPKVEPEEDEIDPLAGYLYIQKRAPSGTEAGQVLPSGVAATVQFNTVVENTMPGVSLSSNTIVGVQAGTYELTFFGTTQGSIKVYLYNETTGGALMAGPTGSSQGTAILYGRFRLDTPSTLSIKGFGSGQTPAIGLAGNNDGTTNVGVNLTMKKVSK